ncbi:hypothetical protein BdWA1_002990 [Babesia duncani]|uniref:Uncharacterized protein n=1 Tax=Babesia duncani TaxID=323732 RepID=A0AAD9PII3_9APIC|nr:hypothetical protein BdWA1_002990 [Babesia duncani]
MGSVVESAVYFNRTQNVDEFLDEFIRIRGLVSADKNPIKKKLFSNKTGDDSVYNRKNKKENPESVEIEDIIQMSTYDKTVNEMDAKTKQGVNPLQFDLAQVLKDTQIKRSITKPVTNINPRMLDLREIEEKRYQRMVQDISHSFNKNSPQAKEFKPPIIAGSNIFFGVGLTFFGAYSLAGLVGIDDALHRSLIGIACSFITLIVDTALFILRSNNF